MQDSKEMHDTWSDPRIYWGYDKIETPVSSLANV